MSLFSSILEKLGFSQRAEPNKPAPAPAPTSAPQAAPVVQPQVMPQAAPPQTFPPQQAMGMPPSPFPAAAPQPVQQPACPFADAGALQAWAYAKYQANPALMPQMEAIIKQHGLERMDLARPDQLPSLYAAINAL